jgi:hypothetical protein
MSFGICRQRFQAMTACLPGQPGPGATWNGPGGTVHRLGVPPVGMESFRNMKSPVVDPYAPPATPVPERLNLQRVGIRFGLLFGSPFLVLSGLGTIGLLRGDIRVQHLLDLGLWLAIGIAQCVCGWWWAHHVHRRLGRFLLVGIATGLAMALLVSGLFYGYLAAEQDFQPANMDGALPLFVVMAFLITLWVTLMGLLVRWRVHVLVQRAAQ